VAVEAEEEPMELTEEVVESEGAGASVGAGLTQSDMSAAGDKSEDNMVDLLQEIDQALEQQYKENAGAGSRADTTGSGTTSG